MAQSQGNKKKTTGKRKTRVGRKTSKSNKKKRSNECDKNITFLVEKKSLVYIKIVLISFVATHLAVTKVTENSNK